MDKLLEDIQAEGFEAAVAIATRSEVEVGAACGQMTLMTEE